MKTIGTPAAAAEPEIVPSLFVLNSRGATLQGETLLLTGVTPSSITFDDRPARAAGHQPAADIIAEWAFPIRPVGGLARPWSECGVRMRIWGCP